MSTNASMIRTADKMLAWFAYAAVGMFLVAVFAGLFAGWKWGVALGAVDLVLWFMANCIKQVRDEYESGKRSVTAQ